MRPEYEVDGRKSISRLHVNPGPEMGQKLLVLVGTHALLFDTLLSADSFLTAGQSDDTALAKWTFSCGFQSRFFSVIRLDASYFWLRVRCAYFLLGLSKAEWQTYSRRLKVSEPELDSQIC